MEEFNCVSQTCRLLWFTVCQTSPPAIDATRRRAFALVSQAYTSIIADDFAAFVGLPVEEAVKGIWGLLFTLKENGSVNYRSMVAYLKPLEQDVFWSLGCVCSLERGWETRTAQTPATRTLWPSPLVLLQAAQSAHFHTVGMREECT